MTRTLPELSRFELQCLRRLWERGESSVKEVHEELGDPPSYSTVRKIIERLEEKGAVVRVRKQGKAWIYRSAVRPTAMIRKEIRRLLDSLFDGAASPLVAHLADMDALSIDDLREIEANLDGISREKVMLAFMNALETFWFGMATHLWQTTLILIPLALIARSLRGAPGRVVTAFWWITLLKLWIPLHLAGRAGERLLAWLVGGVDSAEGAAVEILFYPQMLRATATAGPTEPRILFLLLTVVWFLALSFILLRGLIRYAGHGRAPAVETARGRGRLLATAADLSIPARALVLSAEAVMPSVRGLLRPRIVIPARMIDALEDEDLRAVLLHEEAHRRRRDPLLSAVLSVTSAVFCFYPVVWWLLRRIRENTEITCDEAALDAGIAPRSYSRSLARALHLGLVPAVSSSALGGRSALRRRFERLHTERRFVIMPRHRILLCACTLFVLLGALVPVTPTPAGEADVDRPRLAGSGGVTNPELIPESKVDPVYPESMRKGKIQGKVMLQATISAQGEVEETEVLNATPDDQPDMVRSAIDAVEQWRYEPATLKGEPVRVYFTVFIEYKLQ